VVLKLPTLSRHRSAALRLWMKGLLVFGLVAAPILLALGATNAINGWAGGVGWTIFLFAFAAYTAVSVFIAAWRESRLEERDG
jgi:hypothetical protein